MLYKKSCQYNRFEKKLTNTSNIDKIEYLTNSNTLITHSGEATFVRDGNPFSAGTVFIRQNLTSVDVRPIP